jgi:hypothetical protein
MVKRLEISTVQAAFEAFDYKMLSSAVNASAKIKYECPNGHRHSISWGHFKEGRRCPECYGNSSPRPEAVRAAFEVEGYKMVGPYINNKTKIGFECPKGHHHSITWKNFRAGKRCAKCIGARFAPPDFKRELELEGYKMLSLYRNNRIPVDIECPKGHKYSITWNNFREGRRCSRCKDKDNFFYGCIRAEFDLESVKSAFTSEGYEMLTAYVNQEEKIKYRCPSGHLGLISWSSFRQGVRCAECVSVNFGIKTVKAAFEAEGYKMLSPYISSAERIRYECPLGHQRSTTWRRFRKGNRCLVCAKRGFDSEKPGKLYYVRFDFGEFSLWKIGITNRTVKGRFRYEPTPYAVLNVRRFPLGADARAEESRILSKYLGDRYKGPHVLLSGNTECFTRDVLGLDTQANVGLSDSWKLDAILDRVEGKREDSPKEKTFRHRKATYHQLDLFAAA